MKYTSLFLLTIEHAFYADGRSADFQLLPSPECGQLLRRHRMRWREEPSGGRLITTVTKEQGGMEEPRYPLAAGATLRFFLKLTNPKAIQFTLFHADLEIERLLKGHLFLRFDNSQEQPEDQVLELESELASHFEEHPFAVQSPSRYEPFFLETPPLPGLSEENFSISGLPVQYPESYFEEEKRLEINTYGQSVGTLFQVTFKAIPQWSEDVIGVVDIEARFPKKMGMEYVIALQPRSVPWQYYVVSNQHEDDLSVMDSETESGRINFKKATISEEDPVGQWLQKKFPAAPTIALYQSESPIPYAEQRSKNIRLVDTSSDDRVLIDHLPVPSRDNPEVQIVNHYS